MPEWPGAVLTRLSFAWHEVQLVQPWRGWPMGGTVAVPTPPAAVVWQPRQSAPAGIVRVTARGGADDVAPGSDAEGPRVAGAVVGPRLAFEVGPAVEPGAADPVPGAAEGVPDVATGTPPSSESISRELTIPMPTTDPTATAATIARPARIAPRLPPALTARLPSRRRAVPQGWPAPGARARPRLVARARSRSPPSRPGSRRWRTRGRSRPRA